MFDKIQAFQKNNKTISLAITFFIGIILLTYSIYRGFRFFFESNHPLMIICVACFSLLFFSYSFVYYFIKHHPISLRILVITLVLSAFFSILTTVVSLFETVAWSISNLPLNAIGLCKHFVLFFIRIPAFFNMVLFALIFSLDDFPFIQKWNAKMSALSVRKKRIVVFTLIMLSDILMLLILWPGSFAYDAPVQLDWYQKNFYYTHHPILHTQILGWMMDLGILLGGGYELGQAIYSITQMLFISFALERAIVYVSKYSNVRAFFLLLFIICTPTHAILSVTVLKDTYFTAFFILWIILILHGKDAKNWSVFYFIQLTITTFFMCAFRNNGIYVFVVAIPFMCLIQRKNLKKVLLSISLLLLVWSVYTGPIYRLLDVQAGSVKEMLSVPIQQISNVFVTETDNLSEEEKSEILNYIPDASDYEIISADATKEHFNVELYAQDDMAFWKLWLQLFKEYPMNYLNAFIRETDAYYFPFANSSRGNGTLLGYESTWTNCVIIPITSVIPSLKEEVTTTLTQTSRNKLYQSNPLLMFSTEVGLFFWILILEIGKVIYEKRWHLLLCIVPIFLYWGTCLLGPVVLYRYSFPIILATAILSVPVFAKRK